VSSDPSEETRVGEHQKSDAALNHQVVVFPRRLIRSQIKFPGHAQVHSQPARRAKTKQHLFSGSGGPGQRFARKVSSQPCRIGTPEDPFVPVSMDRANALSPGWCPTPLKEMDFSEFGHSKEDRCGGGNAFRLFFFTGSISFPAGIMKFTEVPNLSKFEKFAQEHPEDDILQHAYRMVEARLGEVQDEPPEFGINPHGPEQILQMKNRCEAIEQSTRIIWACAAATGNVDPPMWEDGVPDFQESVEYFWNLPDLEWMELTHVHRIRWEQRISIR